MLLSHEHLHVILMVPKMGLDQIVTSISGVQTYDNRMSKKYYENLKIVTRVCLDHESSDPENFFEKSHCSVAQVHHHE